MPEPYSISLLNDSFPPLIDGVANTVVNYARELTKLGDRAIVVTPEHPDADDSRFPFPVVRYPSVDTRRLFGYLAGYPFSPETLRQLDAFAAEQGYCPDFSDTRFHHEIYLGDPRRTAPEKLKTVLRHPIRKIE